MAEDTKVVYDIQQVDAIRDVNHLKAMLNSNYKKMLENTLGNEERALKFLSAVAADVQRNPKLLECTPESVINAYVIMASCGFMPSAVSGEAYVIPYENSKKVFQDGREKWIKVSEAQFQIGYQGLVTLFYKAGIDKITWGIVHEEDDAEMVNGELVHKVPLGLSKEERGKPIGAYVTVLFRGQESTKYMNGKDIIAHAKKFSKSYNPDSKGWKYSPWNPENDPEYTMWLKTVLKQHSKLLPKNENIQVAIAADNADSKLNDRLEAAKEKGKALEMGNLEIGHGTENKKANEAETKVEDEQVASGEPLEDNEEPAD